MGLFFASKRNQWGVDGVVPINKIASISKGMESFQDATDCF